jgi:hypothetical protein
MKATIDIPLQGLELLEKPKQKMTMIVPGGGMMGCDSRNMIVSLEPVAAAPSAPARKELLTAVMKKKLMDRDGKPAKPIFKIFDPGGAGTWLLCSLEPDGDTLWAVCDLGFGCVEYGTVSLEELETARSQSFNLHMERDKYFAGAGMSVSALTSLSSLQQWQEVKS